MLEETNPLKASNLQTQRRSSWSRLPPLFPSCNLAAIYTYNFFAFLPSRVLRRTSLKSHSVSTTHFEARHCVAFGTRQTHSIQSHFALAIRYSASFQRVAGPLWDTPGHIQYLKFSLLRTQSGTSDKSCRKRREIVEETTGLKRTTVLSFRAAPLHLGSAVGLEPLVIKQTSIIVAAHRYLSSTTPRATFRLLELPSSRSTCESYGSLHSECGGRLSSLRPYPSRARFRWRTFNRLLRYSYR